jgi:dGTPase
MPDSILPLEEQAREELLLAPYAMRAGQTRGRRFPEHEHPYRSAYQRDRDRIIHSAAFRRLMYKTQVLVNHTSDHHRTRLTHTLEVAQISRTIARRLRLNEDLTEAIALAHDLGHPPFGHAGEEALDECMAAHGGFEHNRHGLRIVEQLEHRYPSFPGLNLTWELRESMAHHSKRPDAPEVREYRVTGQPFLEAQVVDAADSLAYDTHDIDDALSVQLITMADLQELEFWRLAQERLQKRLGPLPPEYLQPAMVRALIDWQVDDLLDYTGARLIEHGIRSLADVQSASELLAGPSPRLLALKNQLEEFLKNRVYRHYRVIRMTTKAKRFLKALFAEYCEAPDQMPPKYAQRAPTCGVETTVCDYLAGMTDRFAQDEYLRLFHPYESM